MVRTNAQILSFSDIVGEKDDEKGYINSYIEDSRFLYRDVAGNTSLGDKYKNMLGIDLNKMIAKKLKVGYMIKSGDKFRIQPAKELKEGMPYFRVVEEDFKKIWATMFQVLSSLMIKITNPIGLKYHLI